MRSRVSNYSNSKLERLMIFQLHRPHTACEQEGRMCTKPCTVLLTLTKSSPVPNCFVSEPLASLTETYRLCNCPRQCSNSTFSLTDRFPWILAAAKGTVFLTRDPNNVGLGMLGFFYCLLLSPSLPVYTSNQYQCHDDEDEDEDDYRYEYCWDLLRRPLL